MIPQLISFMLGGDMCIEETLASTTQMIDADVTLDPARAPIVLLPQLEDELSGAVVYHHHQLVWSICHFFLATTLVLVYPIMGRTSWDLQMRGYLVAAPTLVVSPYTPPSHLHYVPTLSHFHSSEVSIVYWAKV